MKIAENNKAFHLLFFQDLKVIFLFLILVCCTNFMYSQTLEFSQVKLVSTIETVPSGKVWKITAVLPNDYLTSSAGYKSTSGSVSVDYTYQFYKVDGETICFASSDSRGFVSTNSSISAFTSSALTMAGDVIWLPAGTTLEASSGVAALSVIEFTVVP